MCEGGRLFIRDRPTTDEAAKEAVEKSDWRHVLLRAAAVMIVRDALVTVVDDLSENHESKI